MTMSEVGIVDLDISNIGSLVNTISNLDSKFEVLNNPERLERFNKVIIPGVGSYDKAMINFINKKWVDPLKKYANNFNNRLLGICLGMQILSTRGFENEKNTKGLDIISGNVENLSNKGCKLQLPHIGWNEVKFKTLETPLFEGIPNNSDFYFVHSYGFFATNSKNVIGVTNYDIEFASVIQKNNIFGVQFHPEKSSFQGKKILSNFINLNA